MTPNPASQPSRLRDKITASSRYISVIRTMSPLVWAAILTWFSERNLDLSATIALRTGIDEELVNGLAPLVIAAVLWAIATFAPSDFVERLLLGIQVDDLAYERGDDVVLRNGKIRNDQIIVTDAPIADVITSAVVAANPPRSEHEISQAQRLLADYLAERRA